MLKRIELSGFKSFADKVVLEFPIGLVAIVGPNGSGKSNVVDAFRWLLGEREAENLRGNRAEDLIFAGTSSRARLGLAQATILLDNSSGKWPLEFREIAIKRQVSRDGESKYFLNQDEVRLRDLVEFFSKSRLGSRGIALMGQGNSDVFIKATPLERKAMLEEILGLKEYRLKKNESEKRLESTAINLEKVRTQVDEMLPHLRLLKRQTVKWEKRGELIKELENLENKFFGNKWNRIYKGLEGVGLELEKLETETNKQKEVLSRFEEALKNIEKKEPHGREELKKIRSEQNEILRSKSKIERELGRLEFQLEELSGKKNLPDVHELFKFVVEIRKALKNALNLNAYEIYEIIKRTLSQIDVILLDGEKNEHDKALKNSKKKLSEDYEKLEMDLNNFRKEEASLTSALEEFNKIFKKSFEGLDRERAYYRDLEYKRNKLNLEKDKWNWEKKELENSLGIIGRKLSNLVLLDLDNSSEEKDLERRILKLRNEFANMGEIDETLIKETEETESRYNFLTREMVDLEKSSTTLKNLIGNLEEKLHHDFKTALLNLNKEFDKIFGMLFGGGKAKLIPVASETKSLVGVDIEVSLPKKKIKSLEALSGGERSLVSMATLFALVTISPPPFLILDEIDAALDEKNARRFADIIRDLSRKTQFIVVTHNRATMEAADVLYGVTMDKDGTSRVLSLKLT